MSIINTDFSLNEPFIDSDEDFLVKIFEKKLFFDEFFELNAIIK
jgi:hypothetical protein